MNEWFSEFFFCWGLFSVIAAFVALCMSFFIEETNASQISFWDKICVFFVFFPRFAFYAFLAAIGFTVLDFILFNLAERFVHMHGYDIRPCNCGF